ncbi:MAG TPA: hypothetical protein VNL18_06285 [Gemmatimonadales bacterium]|nr:hypothetical protein [Gemmatimonadales bacterium]
MRRLPRSVRVLGASVAIATLASWPAWGLAHGLAHHHDDQATHQHTRSLDSHDGPAEFQTSSHDDGHRHLRVDPTTQPPAQHVVTGHVIATTARPDFDLVPREGVIAERATSSSSPDPPGNDPPRLRAPPVF